MCAPTSRRTQTPREVPPRVSTGSRSTTGRVRVDTPRAVTGMDRWVGRVRRRRQASIHARRRIARRGRSVRVPGDSGRLLARTIPAVATAGRVAAAGAAGGRRRQRARRGARRGRGGPPGPYTGWNFRSKAIGAPTSSWTCSDRRSRLSERGRHARRRAIRGARSKNVIHRARRIFPGSARPGSGWSTAATAGRDLSKVVERAGSTGPPGDDDQQPVISGLGSRVWAQGFEL